MATCPHLDHHPTDKYHLLLVYHSMDTGQIHQIHKHQTHRGNTACNSSNEHTESLSILCLLYQVTTEHVHAHVQTLNNVGAKH